MRKRSFIPFVASLVFFVAVPAQAEEDAVPFAPAHSFRAADFPWESGFQPPAGPLQVNLTAAAYQDIGVTMQGTATHDTRAQTLGFLGDPDGGALSNTLGAQIGATVRVDVPGFAGDIPLGPFELTDVASAAFTPYVLEGGLEPRPVPLVRAFEPHNLVQVPLGVGVLTGSFNLDYSVDAKIQFAGETIELLESETSEQSFASVAHADDVALVPLDEAATRYAVLRGSWSSSVVIHLLPSVNIGVLGIEQEIGPLDLPVEFPVTTNEPLSFDAVALQLAGPSAPPAGDTGTGGNEAPGSDTSDAASMGEDEGSGGSGDDAGADAEDGKGCGCSSTPSSPSAAFCLLLLGLGLIRRRT